MAWWSRTKEKRATPSGAESAKRSVPSGVFQKCDGCGQTVSSEQVKVSLWCCPLCGHHFVMPTAERIRLMLDEFREEDLGLAPEDPLSFQDSKRYADRLKASQKQTGLKDAFRGGMGTIDGRIVSAGFFAFEFMGGSMGSVVGEKIARRFERARDEKCPAILF